MPGCGSIQGHWFVKVWYGESEWLVDASTTEFELRLMVDAEGESSREEDLEIGLAGNDGRWDVGGGDKMQRCAKRRIAFSGEPETQPTEPGGVGNANQPSFKQARNQFKKPVVLSALPEFLQAGGEGRFGGLHAHHRPESLTGSTWMELATKAADGGITYTSAGGRGRARQAR
jgi:hypothetical protein